MEIKTFTYSTDQGWSVPTFPELDSSQSLVFVFGGKDVARYQPELDKLRQHYQQSRFVGCSTAGEIFGEDIRDNSLVVAVLKFETTEVATAFAKVGCAADSFAAGVHCAKRLNRDKLRGVIVFSDGISVNGSNLVEGLHSVLGDEVLITGGLAGDGDKFESTWILYNSAIPVSQGVTAIGFYGDDIELGFGTKGGWDIFGPEKTITKSEGNVVYEIDGQPALELYKKYLGDRADELPAAALLFPLAIRQDENDRDQLVRTILSIDEENQSMTFAGDMPQNSRAQLMKANFDRLIEGAASAGEEANLHSSHEAVFALAVSCVGRRLVLGERAEEEVQATLEKLPENTAQCGFYSYGEIAPSSTAKSVLYNQTMTLTTIREQLR